jgi:RNA polymerase sigma-70 factor (sigma-E family)
MPVTSVPSPVLTQPKQRFSGRVSLLGMTQSDLTLPAVPAAGVSGQPTRAGSPPASGCVPGDPAEAVTALYHAQAVTLIRLARVMLGDAGRAEDIVQEAFFGLYRRWALLADPDKAMQYVRTAVLNGCRTAMRPSKRRERATGMPAALPTGIPGDAADTTALAREQRRAVLTALRMLPRRQLELLVLRFYLDMTESQIAAELGITTGTVRSTAHRALSALSPLLEEVR